MKCYLPWSKQAQNTISLPPSDEWKNEVGRVGDQPELKTLQI